MGLKADTGCNPNRALTNPVVCSWTFCISALCCMFCMSVLRIYASCIYCVLYVLKLLCKRVLTNPVGRSAVLTNPVAGRGHMEPWDMASSTKQTLVSRHRITNHGNELNSLCFDPNMVFLSLVLFFSTDSNLIK